MPEELLDTGNALGLLRATHENLRAIMSNVYEKDATFAQIALIKLLEELQIHQAMEREHFFPLCEANPAAVDVDKFMLGTVDNDILDEMIARLQKMDVNSPSFALTMENLIHNFQHHCFAVEENLFVPLEGGDWDMHQQLTACALQMNALRAQMEANFKQPKNDKVGAFQDMQEDRAREMGRGEFAPRDIVTNDVTLGEEGGAGI